MTEWAAALQPEERAPLELRALYRQYGYTYYKMSRFEEYDFYARNRDFLVSEGVIPFTDTTGRLMALKPDVTLSIVKGCRPGKGEVTRCFYHENVYRVSDLSQTYREIPQAGVEAIGEIDRAVRCEVALLAAKSLRALSNSCVLTLSHLDVAAALLEPLPAPARAPALACLSQKNAHGLTEICKQWGAAEVLPALRELPCQTPAFSLAAEELAAAAEAAAAGGAEVAIDFSLVQSGRYYNGLVLEGFMKGAPARVLSGGQYDPLLRRLGKQAGGVGFAVYLDRLPVESDPAEEDADVLLLYPAGAPADRVLAVAERLRAQGKRVAACKAAPAGGRYREQIILDQNGEVTGA